MKVEIKKLSLANYGDFLNNTKISGNSENKEKADEKYLKSILEDFLKNSLEQ